MSESGITLRGVSKVYEGRRSRYALWRRNGHAAAPFVQALEHVDLEIERGEFTALAGPSGSGKSTLLNLIAGLDVPTAGTIEVVGRELGGMDRAEKAEMRLRYMGFVFQSFNLLPVLTALENVEYVLRLQRRPAAERRERARQALAAVGLAGLDDRRPAELSGGQQQRVAIARAIVHRPQLLLADEITANVDSKTAAALVALMEELNRRTGTTFVFASHDAAVLKRARRVVELQDGRVV